MTQTTVSEPRNHLALVSMILGIAAVVLAIAVIGGLIGIAALVLGIIAIKRPGRHGMSVAGIVTGALAIPMSIVIGLMIAILVPALGKARIAANETRTISNMQQLGLGVEMYSADNKGYFPTNLAGVRGYLNKRSETLLDFRVHKPSALPPGADWTSDPAQFTAHCDFNYAGDGMKVSHLRSPASTIVLYDNPLPKRSRLIVFADGHAERFAAGSAQLFHDVEVTNTAREAAGLPPLPADLPGK
jgi:type II secretory pathway pseudopilin PulG